MPSRAPGITPTRFARNIGVAPSTVSRAISEGRLRASIVRYGPRWRVVDEELAKLELETNTRESARKLGEPERAKPPTRGAREEARASLDEATSKRTSTKYQRERAAKLEAERKLAELKLERERGASVNVDEAARIYGDGLAAIRADLLAMPDRFAIDLAAEGDPIGCREILRRAVREVLSRAARAMEGATTDAEEPDA